MSQQEGVGIRTPVRSSGHVILAVAAFLGLLGTTVWAGRDVRAPEPRGKGADNRHAEFALGDQTPTLDGPLQDSDDLLFERKLPPLFPHLDGVGPATGTRQQFVTPNGAINLGRSLPGGLGRSAVSTLGRDGGRLLVRIDATQ